MSGYPTHQECLMIANPGGFVAPKFASQMSLFPNASRIPHSTGLRRRGIAATILA
jgi:hypothetical protein